MRVWGWPVAAHLRAGPSTRSLGLPFGGVDLAIENRGVVFEVNVHPVFGVDCGLEMVAVPYVEEHLTHASGHLRWETTSN